MLTFADVHTPLATQELKSGKHWHYPFILSCIRNLSKPLILVSSVKAVRKKKLKNVMTHLYTGALSKYFKGTHLLLPTALSISSG